MFPPEQRPAGGTKFACRNPFFEIRLGLALSAVWAMSDAGLERRMTGGVKAVGDIAVSLSPLFLIRLVKGIFVPSK